MPVTFSLAGRFSGGRIIWLQFLLLLDQSREQPHHVHLRLKHKQCDHTIIWETFIDYNLFQQIESLDDTAAYFSPSILCWFNFLEGPLQGLGVLSKSHTSHSMVKCDFF